MRHNRLEELPRYPPPSVASGDHKFNGNTDFEQRYYRIRLLSSLVDARMRAPLFIAALLESA